MHFLTLAASVFLAIFVLWEVFETIVLPRKIERRFRFTRLFYLANWRVFCFVSKSIRSTKKRSAFLSTFGPLSLLALFAVWGLTLAFSFALMNWSTRLPFRLPTGDSAGFLTDLYVSGTTLTTLGLGDVTPRSHTARLSMVTEAAIGLGLFGLVVSYLPTLYQAFSRREVEIALLDARAGSPASAGELLHRVARTGNPEKLEALMERWEHWFAEIMESQTSYPVLCYFRSQHTNQSWVAATTTILDTCAFGMACLQDKRASQAHLTFAMGRHAVVDIVGVFHQKGEGRLPERLSKETFRIIRQGLEEEGLKLRGEEDAWRRLSELRQLYEPHVFTLSQFLRMDLAPWTSLPGSKDNWEVTKWHSEARVG